MPKSTAGFLWRPQPPEGGVTPGPQFLLNFILSDSDPLTYLANAEGEALVWRTAFGTPQPVDPTLPDGAIIGMGVAGPDSYYLSAGSVTGPDRAIVWRKLFGGAAVSGPLPDGLIEVNAAGDYLVMGSGRVLVWSS